VNGVRRWQVLAGTLALFMVAATTLGRTHFVPERRSFDQFPPTIDGLSSTTVEVSNKALAVLDLTDYLSRNYFVDGEPVNVYVGYHGSQRRGSIIHSPRHCLPGNGWVILDRSTVPMPGAEHVQINRMEVAIGEQRQLVYYWYQGRGRIIADEYVSALYRSMDVALRNRSDEALVRFAVNGSDEAAERRLRQFIEKAAPLLADYVPA
jgi:EpsI family protein